MSQSSPVGSRLSRPGAAGCSPPSAFQICWLTTAGLLAVPRIPVPREPLSEGGQKFLGARGSPRGYRATERLPRGPIDRQKSLEKMSPRRAAFAGLLVAAQRSRPRPSRALSRRDPLGRQHSDARAAPELRNRTHTTIMQVRHGLADATQRGALSRFEAASRCPPGGARTRARKGWQREVLLPARRKWTAHDETDARAAKRNGSSTGVMKLRD